MKRPYLAALVAFAALVSCAKSSAPGAPGATPSSPENQALGLVGNALPVGSVFVAPPVDVTNEPGNVFKVSYKPSTVVVDAGTVKNAFRGVEQKGRIWKFDGSATQIARITPGSVVLFSNLALLKVGSVQSQDGLTVIGASPAALTDAIQDGHIRVSHAVDFGTLTAQVNSPRYRSMIVGLVRTMIDAIDSPAFADDAFSGPGSGGFSTQYKSFNIDVKLKAVPGQLNFQVEASRDLGGLNLDITGVGHVTNFTSALDMSVSGGRTTSLSYENKGLSGSVTFTFAGSKDTAGVGTVDPADRFLQLPPLASFPLIESGVPMTIEISTGLLIRPAFTGNNEMARVQYTVNFNGDQAATESGGGSPSEVGSIHGGAGLDSAKELSAIGPLGFVAAMSIPRIDFKTGVNPAGIFGVAEGADWLDFGPTVYTAFIAAGSLTGTGAATSMLPCHFEQLILSFKVGVDLNFFGSTWGGPSKVWPVWHRTYIDPPTQGCMRMAKGAEGQ